MRRHDLLVASYYLNPTNPSTEADHRAKNLVRYALKDGKPEFMQAVNVVSRNPRYRRALGEVLDDAGILVPVPKSSLHSEGSLWVPHEIALLLRRNGIGEDVQLLLERHTAVRRSSLIRSAAERPSAQEHYNSMRVVGTLYRPRRVTLIDDVVTIGRTLMASALRISDAFPGVEVRALVVARSVRHTSLATLQEMLRPLVDTYSMDESGWIDHGPPY